MTAPLSPFAPAIPLAVLHMRDRWWFPPRGVDVEGWIRACREVSPSEAGRWIRTSRASVREARPRRHHLAREVFGDLRPSEPTPRTR